MAFNMSVSTETKIAKAYHKSLLWGFGKALGAIKKVGGLEFDTADQRDARKLDAENPRDLPCHLWPKGELGEMASRRRMATRGETKGGQVLLDFAP